MDSFGARSGRSAHHSSASDRASCGHEKSGAVLPPVSVKQIGSARPGAVFLEGLGTFLVVAALLGAAIYLG